MYVCMYVCMYIVGIYHKDHSEKLKREMLMSDRYVFKKDLSVLSHFIRCDQDILKVNLAVGVI